MHRPTFWRTSGRLERASDLAASLATHRTRLKVPRKHGLLLGSVFMYYDCCVLCVVLGVGVFYIPMTEGYFLDVDSELWWATLYFCQFAYALASFPFLAFEVPIVGELLHGAKKTAYDASGMLCPKLNTSQMKAKMKLEEEDEETRTGGVRQLADAALQTTATTAASIIQGGVRMRRPSFSLFAGRRQGREKAQPQEGDPTKVQSRVHA